MPFRATGLGERLETPGDVAPVIEFTVANMIVAVVVVAIASVIAVVAPVNVVKAIVPTAGMVVMVTASSSPTPAGGADGSVRW